MSGPCQGYADAAPLRSAPLTLASHHLSLLQKGTPSPAVGRGALGPLLVFGGVSWFVVAFSLLLWFSVLVLVRSGWPSRVVPVAPGCGGAVSLPRWRWRSPLVSRLVWWRRWRARRVGASASPRWSCGGTGAGCFSGCVGLFLLCAPWRGGGPSGLPLRLLARLCPPGPLHPSFRAVGGLSVRSGAVAPPPHKQARADDEATSKLEAGRAANPFFFAQSAANCSVVLAPYEVRSTT